MYYLGSRALARCILHTYIHHTYIHPYIHPYINKTRTIYSDRCCIRTPYTTVHTITSYIPPTPPCLSLPSHPPIHPDTYSPSAPNAAKEVPYILLLLAHSPPVRCAGPPLRYPPAVYRLPYRVHTPPRRLAFVFFFSIVGYFCVCVCVCDYVSALCPELHSSTRCRPSLLSSCEAGPSKGWSR